MNKNFIKKLAHELKHTENHILNTINLLNDGNTVPFIARYRKEMTGKMDEDQIRILQEQMEYFVNLESRKATIVASIEEQGRMTPDLKNTILSCEKMQDLENLYLPYKPKKRTRATIAKEQGLEPLANLIMLQKIISGFPLNIAKDYINTEKEVFTSDDALHGAEDIIAESISENADIRKFTRDFTYNNGVLNISVRKGKDDPQSVFEMYFDYSEPCNKIPSHRILAINRGEKEKILRVKIALNEEPIINYIVDKYIINRNSIFTENLINAIKDSYKRLISPAIDREIRNELTEKAEKKAINVFATNLKSLLLLPPLRNKTILGIDPAYRTGCKVAVIDKTGKYLEGITIFPHPPQNNYSKAKDILTNLVNKYNVDSIAIGNGTASRETELLVADLIDELQNDNLKYIIVDEAGASVYSASKVAKEEFPELEASLRGNISIARRLLDPLAELVKIDPKSIGVGQYQHDVNQKQLNETLCNVVEDCVNKVGVNLNTASASLLQYVSGLTSKTAKNIEQYRIENGEFHNRKEIKKVGGIGFAAFKQAAGFLRIPDSKNQLDNTSIHPESYEATQQLLDKFQVDDIHNGGALIKSRIKKERINMSVLADEINIGLPTLEDIIDDLEKPGRDPRDELPKPILKSNVLKMSDLKEDMILKGTVRNVVDFGAFVDIGLKQAGLVHISQLANKFVKEPKDIVSVGDVVSVRVVSIDADRGRIGLSMKDVN